MHSAFPSFSTLLTPSLVDNQLALLILPPPSEHWRLNSDVNGSCSHRDWNALLIPTPTLVTASFQANHIEPCPSSAKKPTPPPNSLSSYCCRSKHHLSLLPVSQSLNRTMCIPLTDVPNPSLLPLPIHLHPTTESSRASAFRSPTSAAERGRESESSRLQLPIADPANFSILGISRDTVGLSQNEQ